MELGLLSKEELKQIIYLVSHAMESEDNKFTLALKLLIEEGKTIKIIAD
ncbi:MAG: hypothetical protein ABEI32_04025 [Halothece sp.]|jgi:hypothetical protein